MNTYKLKSQVQADNLVKHLVHAMTQNVRYALGPVVDDHEQINRESQVAYGLRRRNQEDFGPELGTCTNSQIWPRPN
jgi:hypothetical protein